MLILISCPTETYAPNPPWPNLGVMARPAQPDTAKKFVLTLNTDGTGIDLSGFRDTTRERFVTLLKNSDDVLAALDRAPQRQDAPQSTADPAFTQETVRVALDLLGTINAFVLRMGVAKMVKHPFKVDAETGAKLPLVIEPDIASKAFHLTPEQHAELGPRLEKKMNELKLPDFLEKNLDWYLIGATYVKYCGENAQRAIGAQVMRDMAKHQEQLARTIINKNPKPDSDAAPKRVSNFANGHAAQAPEEFTVEETESFPPGQVPNA